jgi:hypothetical protein
MSEATAAVARVRENKARYRMVLAAGEAPTRR